MIKKIIIYQHDAVGVIGRGKMNLHNIKINSKNVNTPTTNKITNNKQAKNKAKSLIALAILSNMSTVSSQTFADETSVDDIEKISVTATRSAVNIDQGLASQIIITRADIELSQAQSISDLLSTVAGIDIVKAGGKGQGTSVFMRGTNSDHTLVLIDGVRVGSATAGTATFNTISPEMIERIEIVKGPRAALWGSDAIGGVIQIFTRKLQAGEFFAGATLGSDKYQQLKAGIGFSHGDGFTSLNVNKSKSDGFDVKNDGEDDRDGYDFTSVAIRGQQKVSSAFTVDWLFTNDQGDNEYDGYYNGSEIDNHALLLRGTYQSTIGQVDNKTVVSVGQNKDYLDSFANGISQGIFETKRNQLSLVNNSVINPDLQLNVGIDTYQEKIESGTNYSEISRDITGIFTHGLYNYNQLSFEATVRYDDVEDTDSETTYNLGSGYQFSENQRIVLNYGTGFKAPTFNDLYYPFSGNADLTSEFSKTIELFVESEVAGAVLGASFYQTKVEDLIAWTGTTSENVDQVDITGLEFNVIYRIGQSQHEFNATYTDAEDKSTGEQLIRRAKEKFNYKFNTSINNIDLYAEYQFHGKRYDDVWGIGTVKLSSFNLVNLSASYQINNQLKLQARIDNLFDKEYATISNYNSQTRALYLGITYSQF